MNISEHFRYHKLKAVELFSAGICNLNCGYCYIPKHNPFLKPIHQSIIDKVNNGTLIDEIEKSFGTDIEIISHWGTEPTLTLSLFLEKFYPEAIKRFPNIKTIKMSSNFMTDPNILANFVKKFPKEEISFVIQMSLDGPPWITDKNRKLGSTDQILNNIYKFIELINEEKLPNKIFSHFKPTATREDHVILAYKDGVLEDYYLFFDNILDKIKVLNKNNNVVIQEMINPSIVIPQDFTSKDGKTICDLYIKQMELQNKKLYKHVIPTSPYYHRFNEKSNFFNEFYTKQMMFNCSAGDSCFSINESSQIVPCHRLYYLSKPEYAEINKQYGNDEIRPNDRSEALIKAYSANYNNEKDISNLLYRMRSYSDNIKFRISYQVSIIKIMAQIGQVLKKYEDENEALKLAMFTITAMECPIEQYLSSGSIHVPSSALIKLFGNGLCELILKKVYKDRGIIE